jgi:hypothetical protein
MAVWYTAAMTTADTKRIEKLARESETLARKMLKKANELEVYLSVLDYKAGKIREIKSVRDYFRSLRGA